MVEVLFATTKIKRLEADLTLPGKFRRMLEQINLQKLVKGKKVCIKMHLGGNLGYTTIHPLFVRLLVEAVKKAGARNVYVADGSAHDAELRGYTRKSMGTRLVSLYGFLKRTIKVPMGFKTFDVAEIAADVLHADVLIVLSHVKGHGDCGFGGAGKNIAMGCTPGRTRGKMHALEGGISWDATKCKHCNKCIDECPNKANKFDEKGVYSTFWHNCKYCRHCILACPEGALTTTGSTFADFQQAMALVVNHVLKHFGPRTLFINVLTNITIFCDCWGFSTPSLVPDIGILATTDLVAIDRASLDLIKTENLLPDGLPENRKLGEGKHLFEQIHGKDPYLMGDILAQMGVGVKEYTLKEIE